MPLFAAPQDTPESLRAAGMKPLTTPYWLPRERWMLDAVLADLRAGNIEHAVACYSPTLAEVWRKGMINFHSNN